MHACMSKVGCHTGSPGMSNSVATIGEDGALSTADDDDIWLYLSFLSKLISIA